MILSLKFKLRGTHAALDLDEQHLQRVDVDAVVEALLDGVAVAVALVAPRVPPIHTLAERMLQMSGLADVAPAALLLLQLDQGDAGVIQIARI